MGFPPDHSALVNRHYSDLLRNFLINRQFSDTLPLQENECGSTETHVPWYAHMVLQKYQGTNMVQTYTKKW